MSSIKHSVSDLAALVQLYCLEEYQRKDWVSSDLETYHYFKKIAAQQKKTPTLNMQKPPTPQQSARPLIKTPLPAAPKPKPTLEQPIISPSALDTHAHGLIKAPPMLKAEIQRQPIAAPTANDFNDIKKALLEKNPSLKFTDHIPSDEEAKNIKDSWKHRSDDRIIFLSFDHSASEIAFMQQVTTAIKQRISPAELIPIDAYDLNTSTFKLVIASRSHIQAHEQLNKHCRADAEGKVFLGNVPLLLIDEISSYMQDPAKKQILWHTLLQFK